MLKSIATLALGVVVVTGCTETSTSLTDTDINFDLTNGSAIVAQASGAGIISRDLGVRQFSFQANMDENGTSSGNGELTFAGQNLKTHLTFDCLNVDGNVATLSGWIKNLLNPTDAYEPDDWVWVRVVDNGEPSVNDRITLVTFGWYVVNGEHGPPSKGFGPDCNGNPSEFPDPSNSPSFQIDHGNIQVR